MTAALKAFAAWVTLAGMALPCPAVTVAISSSALNNGAAISASAGYSLSSSVGDTVLGAPLSGGGYSLQSGLLAQVDSPLAVLSSTSLLFGNQGVGLTSAPQTVTINNNGASTLVVASVAASGDFTVNVSSCSAVVSGGSCAVTVSFTPTVAGARAGFLSFMANAALSSVSLAGTGVLNSQTIAFGPAPVLAVGGTATLTASASSGLTPVTFASSTATVCTVAGATVTGVALGSCSITATQAGNGAYAPTSNSLSFAIGVAQGGALGNDGDVPLPAWAFWLLGSAIVGTLYRHGLVRPDGRRV
jgi:hypothetical protein